MKKISFAAFVLGLLIGAPAFAETQSFNRNLYYGLINDTGVQALQQFLTTEGDYSGPISGNFFSLTRQGVIEFQQNNGISPASGYFGPLTRVAANTILSQQTSTQAQQQSNTSSQQTDTQVQSSTTTTSALTFQMEAECTALGQEKEDSDAALVSSSIRVIKDEYGYSPVLNTCLYAGLYISTLGQTDTTKDLVGGTFFDLMTGDKITEPGSFAELMGTSTDFSIKSQIFWEDYDYLTGQ